MIGMAMVGAVLVAPAPAAALPTVQSDPTCVAEQPDAESAWAMVGVCARRVEILSERTEVSQTFLNVDGSRTLEESTEPVRVRQGSSWVPVNTVLKPTEAGISPKASVLPVVFSNGGDGPLARVMDGDRELTMSWPGRLPTPVLEGDTAIYRDVLPDVDLRVTAQALGFSEVLVVRTPAAAKNPNLAEVRFGLSTKGVAVLPTAAGGLVARDDQGKPVFTAPAPLMWDSSSADDSSADDDGRPADGLAPRGGEQKSTGSISGSKASEAAQTVARAAAAAGAAEPDDPEVSVPDGARRAVMPVRVDQESLTIVPDQKILTSEDAKFPIYIDPSWTGNISDSAWTSVWSKHKTSSFWKNSTALNNGSTNGSAGAGRTEDCKGCGDHIIRSLFRMDISAVRGTNKSIQSATFRIEQRHSWTCSPASNAKLWLTGAISSSTTWNNQPTWNSSYTAQTPANRKNGAVHGCAGPGTIEFNVTTMVRHAVGQGSTMTVGLRAVDEGTKNQWKRFNHSSPKLSITYNTIPNAPTDRFSDGKACATGTSRPYVLTLTPILAAKHSDPDTAQQNLTTWFHWWPSGGARNDTDKISQASGNPSVVSRAIPAGKLVDGTTYVWQSRTHDGTDYGPWSGTCEFTVSANPPNTPNTVTSTDYPVDSPTFPGAGGVGLPGEFTITPPTVKPEDAVAYAYTLDSGIQPSAAPTVDANLTDRKAKATVTPIRDGVNTLKVWTKDRAGRFSTTAREYKFKVRPGVGAAAEWLFDESSGAATDATGHGNTATLNGTASRVAGRSGIGSALSLDGVTGAATRAGSVMTPHPDTGVSIPVRTDSSFTVTAWVRLNATGGTAQRTILAANGARTFAYALGYSGTDNRWRFALTNSDVDAPAIYSVLSNDAPVAGKWTHLAGVFDVATNRLTLYVNGVAQTATATRPSGFNATTNITIGKRRWTGVDDGFFAGQVDNIRVYNYAVTQSSIALLTLPLPPTISFPDGDTVTAGKPINVKIDAVGDTNVTSYKYSVGAGLLDKTATPSAAGGAATVSVPTTVAGTLDVYAAAVNAANQRSTVSVKRFTAVGAARIAGVVIDAETGDMVPGAVVTLEPGGRSVTTDAGGGYEFTGFAQGTYKITVNHGGRCGKFGEFEIDIEGDTWLDLVIVPYADNSGYTCVEQATAFVAANDRVLTLSGDDAVAEVDLPFAFPFYGQAYLSGWVDTNGLFSFTDPLGSQPNAGGRLPSPTKANPLVAAFWDDLVVDASASVRTATTGSGDARRFVIEWRNVHRKGSTGQRLSFELILAPDGTIITNYDGLTSDPVRGAYAAVGIQAPEAEDGLAYSVNEPVLVSGQAVKFAYPAEATPLEVFDLSGVLRDSAGAPVVGAAVTIDPRGLTTTTGPGGAWDFQGLVADSYTVSAQVGARCVTSVSVQVELDQDRVLDLRLGPDYGTLGYACVVGTAGYVAANTVFPLTGDDNWAKLTLPFPFTYHGKSYTSTWVDTNGLINFGDEPMNSNKTWINPTMPSTAAPNGVVAPFWDDLNVDASASIRTELLGSSPNRRFVVEWRNVLLQHVPAPDNRLTFELVLHENGQIGFHYGTLVTPIQQGAGATVGLESISGQVAELYSFQVAAVGSNSSIVYTPNTPGTISGVLTTAVTGGTVAGTTITLGTGGPSTTTGPDGSYQFTNVPIGEYTVTAVPTGNRCAGQYAREPLHFGSGNAQVDLSVMTDGDEFGYLCETSTKALVPGTITEGWSGDDGVWQKNPPFPIKLYGQSYTSAWISSNGLLTFQDPSYNGWLVANSSPIPSTLRTGVPNAAVYVHWNDWVIDASAKIATSSSGTAPNRQWVIEWRNVHLYGDTSARSSFSVVFDENGTITFTYADINPANEVARGSKATAGIENGSGTIAFQYLHKEALLESGQAITFRPNPPGTGTVSGTVTCQGSSVSGATVAVAGKSVTTAANGTYSITNVPGGTYAVINTINTGNCKGSSVGQVTVGTNTSGTVDFARDTTPANSGYSITELETGFTPANGTVLPLTGDDAYTQITLPFPVTHYGQTYNTAWVDINGLITFINPGGSAADPWNIPSANESKRPRAGIYPLWHDWVVDSNASVRTATTGSSPNRKFIVEWRNVYSYEGPATRITFEVIFDEAGGYTFAYTDNDGTNLARGGGAAIGIENAAGTVALKYTYRQPVLRPGIGLRITPTP